MVDSFTSMTKVYEGTMRLGEETDSYDSDGIIVETRPWRHITVDQVRLSCRDFLGPIQQTPPMHSAIKVKGKRLYELARKGEKVERPARSVFVSEFEISPRSDGGGQDLNFSIVCSKGTYVRSLVHDLGQTLGCGAHMTALRRTGIGEFSVDDAWSVEKLAECMSNSRAEKSGDGRRRRET
ncbi:unnamed protein product [Ostreobium quekettii]|uniref:tRNA pseudouridine(55) synthase n=1 Tax=Ostreobium quekettii TaxID=121088 RepID=A0A8S1JFN8_9CHLO|nr:unnamed protein product [Ostreobium quekettii]